MYFSLRVMAKSFLPVRMRHLASLTPRLFGRLKLLWSHELLDELIEVVAIFALDVLEFEALFVQEP
jgi:hypothetical protein